MKYKFDYKHFIYKSTTFLGGFNEFQGHQMNEGQIWNFSWAFFCKNYQVNSIIPSIFQSLLLRFKDLVNEGQISNLY